MSGGQQGSQGFQPTFGRSPQFNPPQRFGAFQSPGYGQSAFTPRFDGSTQPIGNGMGMKQMGPSMLPPNRTQPNPLMPSLPPGMGYTPTDPSRPPPRPGGFGFTGGSGDFDENTGTYRSTGTGQPPPQTSAPTVYRPPSPPPTPTPAPPPPNPGAPPGRPNPGQFPGLPQIYLDNLSYGPGGRLMFGGDQPVKYENGRLTFDTQPFVPGAGQFGQYGAPGANGFSLDTTGGINRIVGGANGPQIYNAEGLVQGSPAPQNFVNYLNSYRR